MVLSPSCFPLANSREFFQSRADGPRIYMSGVASRDMSKSICQFTGRTEEGPSARTRPPRAIEASDWTSPCADVPTRRPERTACWMLATTPQTSAVYSPAREEAWAAVWTAAGVQEPTEVPVPWKAVERMRLVP